MPAKVQRGSIFVARLVVAVAIVGGDRALPRGAAASDEVAPGAEGERGNAALREGIMVRAEIPARLGRGFGIDALSGLRGGGAKVVFEAGLAGADQFEVARRGEHDVGVEVDDRGGPGQRIDRVRGIIFGAEQALFLGSPGGEDARCARDGGRP